MRKRQNPDRRVQRTRQALMAAFIELVLTRGYEALTAGDISRKANVGRSTFYLHYASKEVMLAESMRNPSSKMAACVGGDVTPPQLVPLMDHFREQGTVNRTFFVDPVRSLWVKSLASLIEPRLTLVARTSSIRPDLPRSFVALMIAEMQIALVTHWVTKRSTLKSELIAATLVANTRAMLSAFGRVSAPSP
jgi:AcrR family transcriptional regulator